MKKQYITPEITTETCNEEPLMLTVSGELGGGGGGNQDDARGKEIDFDEEDEDNDMWFDSDSFWHRVFD